MSPNCRQSIIPFPVKKNATSSVLTKNDEKSAVIKTPRRSARHNGASLLELTPSSALATLEINSPKVHKNSGLEETTSAMPCREKEIDQLEEYLLGNLSEKISGSMYISGLPGTGKTAALTHVLDNKKIISGYQVAFVNCTAVKSSSSIYLRIADELKIKLKSRTEKIAVTGIENFVRKKKNSKNQKMILLVLDEIDQLESKFQTVLYRLFEWPSLPNSRVVLIGIANAVDLTDRVLPRLQALSMQPRLLHFRPYTKDEILTILRHRMTQTDDAQLFAPGALELLSAKVAGQSGDLRRALDLGRRVLEVSKPKMLRSPFKKPNSDDLNNLPVISPRKRRLSSTDKTEEILNKTPRKGEKENNIVRRSPRMLEGILSSPIRVTERTPCKEIFDQAVSPRKSPRKQLFSVASPRRSPRKQLFTNEPPKSPNKDTIRASDVMSVVKLMYGSARNLRTEESAFPLHQKLLISTLLLILTKGKNKDVNIGKLHEVYGRVCSRRGISAVDQSGFISLCRQVEMAGGVEIGKGPGKLAKISLQWDETEVSYALQDSSLLTAILSDSTVLAKK